MLLNLARNSGVIMGGTYFSPYFSVAPLHGNIVN